MTSSTRLMVAAVVAAVALGGGALWVRHLPGRPMAVRSPVPASNPVSRVTLAPDPLDQGQDQDQGPNPDTQWPARPSEIPSGAPAQISCRDARRVIAQVRARIAEPAGHPEPRAFGDAVTEWLDPHGLWSAAPDAPAARSIHSLAVPLIAELERSPRDPEPCAAAREIAAVTRRWVDSLRRDFDAASARAPGLSRARTFALDSRGIFQDDPVTRPARRLAVELGTRVGSFANAYGAEGAKIEQRAATRLLPGMGIESWTGAVLAAAVRAYVPGIDAHGQWAPLDEAWSLYAADATAGAGPRLWGQMMRTPVGVRVIADPTSPLHVGDLVLAVGGVRTVGLSVEQVEQLSRLDLVGGGTTLSVELLRKSDAAPRRLDVAGSAAGADPPSSRQLDSDRVPFGEGVVLVVSVPGVPEGLGEELARLVASAKAGQRPEGILLDLRGNGGGSTDGAAGAIGVFLPGAPSFPLRHRGGTLEVQHALVPALEGQWHGAVASLVDGYTASAAEMIAGALGSYHRGPVVGTRTFGKGCIQEYFDDRSGSGVLRLTTMLFALPDGSPLQHVGLTPDIRLPMAPVQDTEKRLANTMPGWRGPDVRRRAQIGGPAWPSDHGHVGPCQDPIVCRTLRRLGSGSVRRSAAAVVTRAPRRGSSAPH